VIGTHPESSRRDQHKLHAKGIYQLEKVHYLHIVIMFSYYWLLSHCFLQRGEKAGQKTPEMLP
ncbi:MAG: hypothetical protein IJM72_05845, partial [Deltaproteobacteria bacterium]|nr:hypothetical protein [Deltaproteobacteria bacterium]